MKTKKLAVYCYSLTVCLVTLFTIHYSLFTTSVSAQITLPSPTPGATITDSRGLPAQIITRFLPPVITILGFLAVFYIVFAGVRFVISKGDPEKVAEARTRLIYAIVGFIVLILALAATQLIDWLFLRSGAV